MSITTVAAGNTVSDYHILEVGFTGNRLDFEVPGLPESQGSMRGFKTKSGRVVVTSDNKRLSSWRRDAMVAARDAMDNSLWSAGEIFIGPVSVRLTFRLPRPKGHFGKNGLRASAPLRPTGATKDVDKLCRAALDALTGAGVWRDDGQVVHLVADKVYSDRPGVSITVEHLAS
jgi:Holliday junction resolvase RusA-like endonuclease